MSSSTLILEEESLAHAALPDFDPDFEFLDQHRSVAKLPEATYRLQFNRSFTFRDATALVPYLSALGISHCYASPYLKACVGSQHGYDIVDHATFHTEIGGEAEFNIFVNALRAYGLGHILDFVPNHMAVATNENTWWLDVLQDGPSSPYASFFDIDWMPLKPDLAYKVLLPVLGDQYGKVLENGELVLKFDEGAFVVCYHDRRFPIAMRTAGTILRHALDALEQWLGREHPHLLEYRSILTAISHLPPRTETDLERIIEGRREQEVIKRRLRDLCDACAEVAAFVAENVRIFNGSRGAARSFDLLDGLLLEQGYRLSFWRVAADEINYRRFFDINELAAICMENPAVFEETHRLVFRLIEEGKLDGLRIDHPDGLYDPLDYLKRIRRASDFRPVYLVVEKILGRSERLPGDWPVQGTTGYDFLNSLNGLFVDRANSKTFDALYSRFIGRRIDFKDEVYRCKKLVMDASMPSEISVLGHQIDRLSERDRGSRDFTLRSLTEAIREVIACFPVYRTYITPGGVSDADRGYVELAVSRAKRKNPAINSSIFDFVGETLLLKCPAHAGEADRAAQCRFVNRFQQVTSPVMAKAVEDTAFYIYNRLISLNEVGGDPEKFGTTLATFHQQNADRRDVWPHSLLATSTHDTKRSEDVRARINVLSEIPQEWRARLFRWTRLNQRAKSDVDGQPVPVRNDEYFLYQTLIGTWPLKPMTREERDQYIHRIQQYMLKATREAKSNTSWISPHEPYEKATTEFIASILGDFRRNKFLGDFVPFVQRIAGYGLWNSLSQTLLKLASPGVPDIYQGTEVWSFHLVDPDNRRPVDYAECKRLFEELPDIWDSDARSVVSLLAWESNGGTPLSDSIAAAENSSDAVRELLTDRYDGRIKLHLIRQVLCHRRAHLDLYTTGSYLPLETSGSRKEHVCAFARASRDDIAVVVAPRFFTRLVASPDQPPIGLDVWGDTWLSLPKDRVASRFRNLLTGETVASEVESGGVGLRIASVLGSFPVALLARS